MPMVISKPELTEREIEILQRVATGASNRQIAQQLGISANTVKVHLRNIFEKLGVASRTEATLYAIQAGLRVWRARSSHRRALGGNTAGWSLAVC